MANRGKYYMTTAIAYTSGKPHIGNTYEVVLADAIARYRRQEGYDVFFMTGTDEHGQKIENKAAEAGISPKEFVDQTAGEVRRIWDLMNTSYDKFMRTTDEDHEKQVQKIFRKLFDQGDIYKGAYEGWYCTPCESESALHEYMMKEQNNIDTVKSKAENRLIAKVPLKLLSCYNYILISIYCQVRQKTKKERYKPFLLQNNRCHSAA